MSPIQNHATSTRPAHHGSVMRETSDYCGPPAMEELYLYGATMLAAQVWESSLQTLWRTTSRRIPTSGGPLPHRPEELTTTQMVENLGTHFHDEDLTGEAAELVSVQRILAHRYLLLHRCAVTGAISAASVTTELATLGMRFIKSERRLREAYGYVPAAEHYAALGEQVERVFQPIARAVLDRAAARAGMPAGSRPMTGNKR